MKYDGLTGPDLMSAIISDMHQKVEDFGFLGDAETLVEVDTWPLKSMVVQHAIRHAHFNNTCVKSRYGFCR